MTKVPSPSYQVMEKLHRENSLPDGGSDSRLVLIEYLGPFDEGLVSSLSQKLEKDLLARGEKKTIVKRSFAILIEALQNTKLHSDRDESGVKLLALEVSISDRDLRIRFMNLSTEEKIAEVQRRVKLLNEMDAKELKTYYLDVMTNGQRSSKGGAGLGLITLTTTITFDRGEAA